MKKGFNSVLIQKFALNPRSFATVSKIVQMGLMKRDVKVSYKHSQHVLALENVYGMVIN